MRNALVTAGAHRIGRAIVEALARADYGVAIHSRRAEDAASLLSALQARGRRAVVVAGDLGVDPDLAALVPAAREALGPLTLLVNNASLFEPDAVGTLERGQWDRQFAVNLTAPVFLAEAFAAQVDADGSSIVNILDQRVLRPRPQFLSYTLSKSALHVATTTLAQALAPRLRVNAVAPGPTLPSARQSSEAFAAQAGAVPLGHGASAGEIAEAVLFLAHARSVTGQTLAVDGGQHMAWRTPDTLGAE